MDLVRLGLERGRCAEEALEAMTALLGRHGQGGIGDEIHGLSYWSSFLIADPVSAWVLETSGSAWAARPVVSAAAISNRVTLRRDWTRASSDVAAGTDIDTWRHPGLPTGFADTRLRASRAFLDRACASAVPDCDPRAAVGALRDHGTGPWGIPGSSSSTAPPVPAVPLVDESAFDDAGWTLCLHAGETAVTTASMLALLPADPGFPARAWVALGSPCLSVYVPVPVPGPGPRLLPLPAVVGDPQVWTRFAAVRDAVGIDVDSLASVRVELSALEDALWDEADDLGTDPEAWGKFGVRATLGVIGALDRLAASGIGTPESDR
jgi:secernin